MLVNADFYGRRGVVVQKGADGFRFANPGSMRVSLTEAIQDSASDPRNGVMMKMLAMVKYGERASSGLQCIFKTWQSVYHCAPKLEVTTSGDVDRTTLILGFEGHQPDIEAMKLLYDNPDELIEVDSTQESTQENEQKGNAIVCEPINCTQEIANITQENLNSTQEITSKCTELPLSLGYVAFGLRPQSTPPRDSPPPVNPTQTKRKHQAVNIQKRVNLFQERTEKRVMSL